MVVGDTHAEIWKMYSIVKKWEYEHGKKIDGIVQVGDFGVFVQYTDWARIWADRCEMPIPTLVIMGNHEEPAAVRAWEQQPHRIPNLRLLPDGEVVNFLGVHIGGVHGNYSPRSYANPERVRFHREPSGSHKIAVHVYRPSVEKLMEYDGPMDMLITHDSASICFPAAFRRPMPAGVPEILGLGFTESLHAKGCPGFDALLKKHQPKYYFYGHLHGSDVTQVGRTHCELLNATQYSNEPYKVVEF
jgi:predicted phosphodiesterase